MLLDLDFPYSHSALLAGLVPTSCLARMGSVPRDSFDEILLSAVLYHAGGDQTGIKFLFREGGGSRRLRELVRRFKIS